MDSADSFHSVNDLQCLRFDLYRIGYVLISTATARSEIRAGRFDTMRGFFYDLVDRDFPVGFFQTSNGTADRLAGDTAVDEKYKVIHSRDALAVRCQAINREGQRLTSVERHIHKLSLDRSGNDVVGEVIIHRG